MWCGRSPRAAPRPPRCWLVGDELYFVSDGGIAKLCRCKAPDASIGLSVVGGNYSASPLWADGRIYLQNERAQVCAGARQNVSATGAEFPPERTLASYAVTDGALFIRTEAHLYCVGNLSKR